MCRYARLLSSSHGLGWLQGFCGALRWSRFSLFSVVVVFPFITVYPPVCMCTEMFQSAALTFLGGAQFLYYA